MDKIELNALKKMFKNGFEMIADNYEIINDLNVFPVPDGDTGTNLKITTSCAWDEISNIETNKISGFGKLLSRSLLMNARGNSGVIFSQIIKGFVSLFDDNLQLIDIPLLVKCFAKAKEFAYNSVSKPIEGTILTIIKDVSDNLIENLETYTSIEEVLKIAVNVAKKSLDNTPNLLPSLKKADVVDSGGYGLWCFLNGFYNTFNNNNSDQKTNNVNNVTKGGLNKHLIFENSNLLNENDPEKGFGYCSELIIKINSKITPDSTDEKKIFNINRFKEYLLKIGESLVCIQDNDIVKVHLHTLNPGKFLTYAQQFGEFIKIKIENMTEQFYQRLEKKGINLIDNIKLQLNDNLTSKPVIVITSPSKRISEILKNEYDYQNIIDCEDGNPSIEQIFTAIQKTNSKNIILIIDDSNIFLAANQVKGLLENKINIKIITTSNVLESLVIALEFNENTSFNLNEKNISKALKNVHSTMISKSTKDVNYSNIKIKKNDYIGIYKKKIVLNNTDELEILKETINLLMKKIKHADILIIFYDFENENNKKILKEIEEYASSKYKLMCDFKEGKQKVYNYILCLQ